MPAQRTEKPKAAPAPPPRPRKEEESDDESDGEEVDDDERESEKREQKIIAYKTDPIFRIRKESDYDAAVEEGGERLIPTAWYFRFKGLQTDEFMTAMNAINGPPVGMNVVEHHRDQMELMRFNELLSKAKKSEKPAEPRKKKAQGRAPRQRKGQQRGGKGYWTER